MPIFISCRREREPKNSCCQKKAAVLGGSSIDQHLDGCVQKSVQWNFGTNVQMVRWWFFCQILTTNLWWKLLWITKKHPFPRVSTGRHLHRCPRFEKRRKQWGHLWSLQQIPQNVDAFVMKGTCRVVAFCYFCWLSSSKFRVRGNDQGMKTKHFGKGYVMILMNELLVFWLVKKMLGIHYFLESEKRWKEMGVPQNGWVIMENPIKMDDLGGKPTFFGSTSRWFHFSKALRCHLGTYRWNLSKMFKPQGRLNFTWVFGSSWGWESFTADPKITPPKKKCSTMNLEHVWKMYIQIICCNGFNASRKPLKNSSASRIPSPQKKTKTTSNMFQVGPFSNHCPFKGQPNPKNPGTIFHANLMMGVKCIYSWNWPKNSTFLHQFPRNRSNFFSTKLPWPLALRVEEPFPAQLGWVPTPLSQKLRHFWWPKNGSSHTEIRLMVQKSGLGNYKVCIKPVINNGE